MTKYFFIVTFVIVLLLFFFNCSSQPEYDFLPDNIKNRVSFYLRQYNQFPDENIFLIKIAEIFYQENFLNESYNYIRLALNNNPTDSDKIEIYKLKTQIYEKQNNYENAIISVKKLIQLNETIENQIYLSNLYMKHHNYSAAFEILNNLLSKQPNNIMILNKLSSNYLLISQFQKAKEYINKALSIDFTNITALYNLIQVNQQTGNEKELLSNLNRIISYGKNTHLKEVAFAYKIKADIELEKNNFEKALEFIKEATKINNKQWEIYLKKGEIYFKNTLFSESIESYKTAASLNNESSLPLKHIADIYFYNIKETQLALSYYLDALTLNQTSTELLYKTGNIYYNNKDYHKAIFYFEQITDLNNNDFYTVEAYIKIIDMLKKYENYEIGINRCYEAINKFPNFYLLYFILGDLYKITENNDKAIENYMHSIKLNSEFKDVYINLGNLYYEINEFDKAMKYLDIALNLSEDIEMIARLETIIERIKENE